jgi:hypothetical protein
VTLPPELIAALRRGDVHGVLQHARDDNMEQSEYLARLLIEYRRQSTAVLGSHEAFIRRRSNGTLQQVIEPVRVSVANGDVYQLPMNRPYFRKPDGTAGERIRGSTRDIPKDRVIWVDENSHQGMLTFQGFQRVNSVASCSLPQPAVVTVDGEPRTNPFVHRAVRRDGRPGDVWRVVCGVLVIGPAPATGNLVAVSYVLDYDPAKDLQHMLAEVADKHPVACRLVSENDAAAKRAGWHYVDVYGGVGYAFDLTVEAIQTVYRKFINMMKHAEKKAQTVARRNAMRSHPALGPYATVTLDDFGRAVLPVRGWTMTADTEAQWEELARNLERGKPLPELAEVLDIEVEDIAESYDPGAEAVPAADVEEEQRVIQHEDTPDEAARLRHQIEVGLDVLGPDAGTFGYTPDDEYTESELINILRAVSAEVDKGE